jgi:hypothetical protein
MVNSRRRRSYRRNPVSDRSISLLGIEFPSLKNVALSTAGFVAPPFIEGFARKFLPATITSSKLGNYALKFGSVLGLTLVARRTLGRDAGNKVMIGGATYLVAALINDFLPAIGGGAAGVRYYPRMAYYPSLRSQPLLRDDGDGSQVGSQVDSIPERVNPAARF